ncbi:hypothetical protein D3C83_150130 [compost metagenome]
MIECGEYLSFFAKATEDKIGVHAALHQFDCGTLVKFVIRARSFVDGAHAAASDLSFNAIRTETPPEHRVFLIDKRLECD